MLIDNIEHSLTNELADFLTHIANKLGTNNVLINKANINFYKANVTAYERDVSAIISAKSAEEIKYIVSYANQYKIPLYPISQGKNWGMGSKLPASNKNVIIDLSAMNRIIEVNTEFGYAVIEPGVTQKQLADYLKKHDIPYFLDVTGSGCETSIVGNTLERGTAYNSIRVENCLNIEAIIGTGEQVSTGYGHYTNAITTNLYKYGVGADLAGLFFQSNLGIVTRLTVKLLPLMPYRRIFLFSITDKNNLSHFFTTIKKLKSYNLFKSILHVANRKRSKITLAPLVQDFCKNNGIAISDDAFNTLIEKEVKGVWNAVGSLMGTKKQVKAAQYELKKQLANYGKVKFFNENNIDKLLKLLKCFRLKKLYILLSAVKPLLGLTVGKPTNAALKSVVWPNGDLFPNTNNPDHSAKSGILFCLPILPLNASHIDKALMLIHQVTNQFNFEPAITLNILNEFAVETVLSIEFDRSDKNATKRAHQCLESLYKTLIESGYYPYRMDINNMRQLFEPNAHWQSVYKIKKVFDPNNIIAPGRYMPIIEEDT